MKKFIAAFDGLRFSESVRDYAVLLAKQNSAHLVGVFLDDMLRTSYSVYDLISKHGDIEETQKHFDEQDSLTRNHSVQEFENACRRNGLNYSIHRDRNIALQELLHESCYADLLIIDNSETLSNYKHKTPADFIRDLLSLVQCPVLVVPHQFKSIDNLVLLYDGEPSSVYAVKMFSYILPSLKQEPAEVLTVKEEDQDSHLPDNKLMKEFMKRHFPNATYTLMKGRPESTISGYLEQAVGNPLVILGAYRRNVVSRWFRPSMADALMRELQLPLFIAHSS